MRKRGIFFLGLVVGLIGGTAGGVQLARTWLRERKIEVPPTRPKKALSSNEPRIPKQEQKSVASISQEETSRPPVQEKSSDEAVIEPTHARQAVEFLNSEEHRGRACSVLRQGLFFASPQERRELDALLAEEGRSCRVFQRTADAPAWHRLLELSAVSPEHLLGRACPDGRSIP